MTNMYKVGLIDDEEGNINDFILDFETIEFGESFDFFKIELQEDIDAMYAEIIEQRIDALIVDYRLKGRNHKLTYDEKDIYEKITTNLEGFPVIILTSYEDAAEESVDNPFLVIERKKDYPSLSKKLLRRIERYNLNLQVLEKEYQELLKIREPSLIEEKRMIELDSKLEKALFKKFELPEEFKSNNFLNDLTELIKISKNILDEVK